jgi:ATP-binding cassette subfamily G (WHITE) protein 2 (PDR)
MEQTPPDYTGLDKNIDAEVRSIAESMYQTRREGVNDSDTDEELQRTNTIQPNLNVNPFLDTSDPQLDPLSKEFNSRKWIKTILGLKARFGNSRSISAGVSFKNLSAFGYGGGNDYQKTFTNSVMAIGPMIKKVLGGNKGSEVQILRHFDGLVRAGETCVVLGRPGSGCTTFLKSVACETYGFHLGEKSEWNYQGE